MEGVTETKLGAEIEETAPTGDPYTQLTNPDTIVDANKCLLTET